MESITNASSKSSSFDESLFQPHAPLRDIQLSKPNPPGEITPSTSLSAPSSQDPPEENTPTLPDIPVLLPEEQSRPRVTPLPSDLACSPSPIVPSRTRPDESKVPGKRMANGDFKQQVGQQGHPQPPSAPSRQSQIGELSSQLRTRLSYAMLKVQNGWQEHSFDELESLSQQASPVSAVSEVRRSFDSTRPKFAGGPVDQIGFSQSSKRSTATPDNVNPIQQVYSRTSPLDGPSSHIVNPTHLTPMTQDGLTYESFWRQHSTSNALRDFQVQSPRGGPSLAPPVDIVPRNRRRTNSLRSQPPFLDTCNASYDSRSSNSLGSNSATGPATPPKRLSTMRTPSQKAAMEQDAVETLLFMSSPGHSGHHPPTKSVGTPLRSSFKRVGFTDISGDENGSDEDRQPIRPSRTPRGFPKADCIISGANVDRLLDEMPDEDSSSEDEDLKTQR